MRTFRKDSDYHVRLGEAASLLRNADRILILFHAAPDGDAIGSAYALCRALQQHGKKAEVGCSDAVPPKYGYLMDAVEQKSFKPDFVVAVDIAAVNLLGEPLSGYRDRIDLCIDHHISNTGYAALTLLDTSAAATCEIIADLLEDMQWEIDGKMADCLYTGLATDTGCFRFSNATAKTLRCAADMIDCGARSFPINKALFDTLTRPRLEIEKAAYSALRFFYQERVALITITGDMCRRASVEEADLEGIPAFAAKVEGVLIGITIKETEPNTYKISVRTNGGVNASAICAQLGGGGHAAAAGCQLEGDLAAVENTILEVAGKAL